MQDTLYKGPIQSQHMTRVPRTCYSTLPNLTLQSVKAGKMSKEDEIVKRFEKDVKKTRKVCWILQQLRVVVCIL